MSTLICDTCGEEYEAWAVADGEPCPKVRCHGEIHYGD